MLAKILPNFQHLAMYGIHKGPLDDRVLTCLEVVYVHVPVGVCAAVCEQSFHFSVHIDGGLVVSSEFCWQWWIVVSE